MVLEIKNLITWLKQWFYDKDEVNNLITQSGGVIVDTTLDTTSTNPVQNMAIANELNTKVDKETGKGLFSGAYNDLTGKPTIPTNTSDLTNDGSDGINPFLTEHQSLSPTLVYDCSSFSSYIDTTATNTLRLYKLGNIYLLRYFLSTKTLTYSSTDYNINSDQIGSDYRPGSTRTFHVASSSNHNAKITITSAGKVTISTDANSTSISLAGTVIYWW